MSIYNTVDELSEAQCTAQYNRLVGSDSVPVWVQAMRFQLNWRHLLDRFEHYCYSLEKLLKGARHKVPVALN